MPASDDTRPSASLVVAVRDGWSQTLALLVGLIGPSQSLGLETIVVDDGSTDETAEGLPRLPGLVTVRADQPRGLVAARNHGATLARGPVVVFLGNGVEITREALEALLLALAQDAGLAAARPASQSLWSDGLAIRADALRRMGGLDAAFRDGLAELDLAYRLDHAGLRHAAVAAAGLTVKSPWGAGIKPAPGDEALLVSRWRHRLGATPPSGPAPATVTGGRGPRFSVLVPCYNQAHFLTAALDSLRAQTFGEWEALVVDDGSTDATTAVAETYARLDPRIRPFRKPNGGVASALNHGLAEARGEWTCWLSSDDLFLPDKLAAHLSVIRSEPSVRFMHTDFELLWQEQQQRRSGSGVDRATFIPPVEEQVVRFLLINYFNGITVAVHREVFQAVGGFNEAFRYGQDYDLWLRASARFRSRYLDRPTAVTRLHAGQGTVLFTEAGIFDSARAAGTFLRDHRFEALFPALDLARPDHALRAIVAAARIALHPASFAARCGFAPVLMGRALEFLANAPLPVRDPVQRALREVVAAPGTEPAVSSLLQPLLDATPSGFTLAAFDPLEVLAGQVTVAQAAGDVREHQALERYLRMVRTTRGGGLEVT